jgi:allophanate hydrolase
VTGAHSPTERVELAYDRIAAAGRDEIWTQLRPRSEAVEEALRVEERLAAGHYLPLAGITLAVKDNIDVAGFETTAGCPAFAYRPAVDAPAVTRCRANGAVVLGKTNLDQFATGLVGTRSPYGAVRDARDSRRVSGGSSSGSAVAVALGIADLALGTDTAGSGRVPAAFQGITGVKPTRGIVSMLGVVPACRSFDCVSVFAPTASEGAIALRVLAASDASDSSCRSWPLDAPLAAPPNPRVAVAVESLLEPLSSDAKLALSAMIDRLRDEGAEVLELDVEPLLCAGRLLYGGAFVAERFAAVGSFGAGHLKEVDPVVAEIILGARSITASRYVTDYERLTAYRLAAEESLRACDALLLPTAPFQPTIDQVQADPIDINAQLGVYTTFCNLLDMCAIALPAGQADGGHFGVTLFAPAFHDAVLADLAARFARVDVSATPWLAQPCIELLVVGAHMRGQPLNAELVRRGARYLRQARGCRLYRHSTSPSERPNDRVRIEGEIWALPPAALASLLERPPQPIALGPVVLEGGTEVVGFVC